MLRIWLPLNGNLNNQGLSSCTVTSSGATVNTAGKIGSCYSFDGNDDYISINCPDLYNIFTGGSQEFSVAFWIYHADSTRAIVFGDYGLTGTIGFNIELTTDHRVRFYWNGAPDQYFAVTTSGWTHFVLTYSGTELKLYKDGILQSGSYLGTLAARSKTTGLFYLGRDSRTGTTAFNGKLNDFRIYDHCLSSRECKQISTALVLHYPLAMPGQENLLQGSKMDKDASKNWEWAGVNNTMNRKFDNDAYYFETDNTGTVNNSYCMRVNRNTIGVQVGDILTVSMDIRGTIDGKNYLQIMSTTPSSANFWAYTTRGTNPCSFGETIKEDVFQRYSLTFTLPESHSTNTYFYIFPSIGFNSHIWYRNVKLERGSIATPWIPNSADSEYTAMGFNNGVEYDVSGYGRNGLCNNVTYSSDSPRYNTCCQLSGSSSYIKVNDSTWKVNGSEALTINEWVYSDNWSNQTNAHLWSCTESGGFNTESGGTGKLRFPVNVYTDSQKTSHGYINAGSGDNVAGFVVSDLSSGWHMFTAVYTTSNIRTYIDGVLQDSKDYTSYGLYYSNASLYLGAEATASSHTTPYFNGKLSDFRLYCTALSADDILSLYQTPISLANNGTLLTQGELQEV